MKTKTASRSAKKTGRPVSRAAKTTSARIKPKASTAPKASTKPKASTPKKSTATAKAKPASAVAAKYQQSGAPWWKAFL